MYQEVKLLIDEVDIVNFDNVNIDFAGNNTVNKLTCTITDPDFSDATVLNSTLVFYLNYGCSDETPFFRGIIRDYTPSDKSVNIIAYDPRVLISGKTATQISLTDTDNYDGNTLAQFTQKIIEDTVNTTDKVRIGLDMLNEPDPPIRMGGIRGENKSPYDFIKEALDKASSLNLSDEAYGEVNAWKVGIVEESDRANIVFYKEQSVINEEESHVSISYADNLKSYSYKIRPVPSVVTGTTKDGQTRTYVDGNTPSGVLGINLKEKFDSPSDIIDAAVRKVALHSVQKSEINIQAGKLAYMSLGDTIKINVPDDIELSNMVHRIKSKKISYSHNKGTNITIGLNKDRTLASDYLRQAD